VLFDKLADICATSEVMHPQVIFRQPVIAYVLGSKSIIILASGLASYLIDIGRNR
jgi:hypothetical protein